MWAQRRPLDPVAEQDADEALDADVGAAGFSLRLGPRRTGLPGHCLAPTRRGKDRSVMGTDAAPPRTVPPEQRLADRLVARQMRAPSTLRATAVAILRELGQVDL